MATIDANAWLVGTGIVLEPLGPQHATGLAAAAAPGHASGLYRWSPVPNGHEAANRYIAAAMAWRDRGDCVPFAAVRACDGAVIGSTRFRNFERWVPPTGTEDGRAADACEIGHTWLAADSVGTGANAEAKLLMLACAFERWRLRRVCFHTDVRNDRSHAALTRLGAQFEGVLRAHRLAADGTVRDSARFSIVEQDWPAVRDGLRSRVDHAAHLRQ